MRWVLGIGVMLVGGMLAAPSLAARWSRPTDMELRLLPPYCTAKLKNLPGGAQAYAATVGAQYTNIHHYCNGLAFLNRYYRAPMSAEGRSYLAFAVNEFDYMVDHLFPDSPLAPQIYLSRGTALALSKRYPEAARDMAKAVALNPKFAQGYQALADLYSDQHQQAKALETVTDGLRQLPDDPNLKRRYRELGGKLPYPEPATPSVAASPPSKAAPPETAAKNDEPAPDAEETEQEDEEKPADTAQPKIGSPTNPWCRFCPDLGDTPKQH